MAQFNVPARNFFKMIFYQGILNLMFEINFSQINSKSTFLELWDTNSSSPQQRKNHANYERRHLNA